MPYSNYLDQYLEAMAVLGHDFSITEIFLIFVVVFC